MTCHHHKNKRQIWFMRFPSLVTPSHVLFSYNNKTIKISDFPSSSSSTKKIVIKKKNINWTCFKINMGVSKNRGTPKSSIFIGLSMINHPFWGVFPLFLGWHPHAPLNFLPSPERRRDLYPAPSGRQRAFHRCVLGGQKRPRNHVGRSRRERCWWWFRNPKQATVWMRKTL